MEAPTLLGWLPWCAANRYDVAQVRWEVWRRLYNLAAGGVEKLLSEQYAKIGTFYAEVTSLPVNPHWSHEN